MGDIYVMLCTIWYRSLNLKNVKNVHEGETLLVNFTDIITSPFTIFNFYKWMGPNRAKRHTYRLKCEITHP